MVFSIGTALINYKDNLFQQHPLLHISFFKKTSTPHQATIFECLGLGSVPWTKHQTRVAIAIKHFACLRFAPSLKNLFRGLNQISINLEKCEHVRQVNDLNPGLLLHAHSLLRLVVNKVLQPCEKLIKNELIRYIYGIHTKKGKFINAKKILIRWNATAKNRALVTHTRLIMILKPGWIDSGTRSLNNIA
jgi:hypothetical protein